MSKKREMVDHLPRKVPHAATIPVEQNDVVGKNPQRNDTSKDKKKNN